MVLHRPVELAGLIGMWPWDLAGYELAELPPLKSDIMPGCKGVRS
jgi:hypothetical protein